MKKRKILYLFPLAALVLSGCTIQEGWEIAKNWTVDSVYTPVKDFVLKLLGKEQKKEEKPSGGDQSGDDQSGDQGGDHGGGDQGGGGDTENKYGTLENPLTIAQAAALLEGETPQQDIYVTGRVKSNEAFSTQYESVTVWLTNGTTDFQLYSCKLPADFSPAAPEANDSALVGKFVVAHGSGKKFGSSYELDKGCQMDKVFTKEIVSLGKVNTPESIEQGDTLSTAKVLVETTFSDNSVELVRPDSIDLDTSVVGDNIQGTAHVGQLTATFTIKVTAKEVGVEHDELTAEYLGLGGYADGSKGVYEWTALRNGDNESIQGNKSRSSELHNKTAFVGDIVRVELEIGAECAAANTASISFGTAKNPTGNTTELGKDTDYDLTTVGTKHVITAPQGCKFFELDWTNGAVYYSTIKIVYKAKVEVESITLNTQAVTLHIGGANEKLSETLTATVLPENATDPSVTWSAENVSPEGCISVDNKGVVSATKRGTATIKATAGSESATCSVEAIQHVTSVTLPATDGIVASNSKQYSAQVLPTDANDQEVTYSLVSAEPAGCAEITSTGMFTANAVGEAVIKATADGVDSGNCTITITANTISVTGITLDEDELDIQVGDTATLTATVAPKDATNQNVEWSSDNNEVSVQNGVVSVAANATIGGQATITATTEDGGFTATCVVTIVKVPVTSVTLNKNELDLDTGDTETLTATVAPNNASYKTVSWTSSNDSVAEVDNTGKVTAVGAGSATITATADGKSDTCAVTVTTPPKGSLKNPYTVSEAIAAQDAGQGNTKIYVKGVVSAIVTAYSAANKNISFNISADGLTSGAQLQSYRGKSSETYTVDSELSVEVGDSVILYGDLDKYNSNYQLKQGNTVISCTKPGVKSLTLSGSALQTEYGVGDAYNQLGIAATAVLDTDLEVNVSENAVWAFEHPTAQAGDTTVNVTATYREFTSAPKAVSVTVGNDSVPAKGSANSPLSVAEAQTLIDSGADARNVHATGVVSEIVTEYSTSNKNVSFNISADGSKEGAQLQSYRGKGSDSYTIDSADDIEVGDTVVIVGNLKKHNTTYEFDQGNQVISCEKPTVSTVVVSGTASKTSYYVGDDFNHNGLVATANLSNGLSKDVSATAEWTISPAKATTTGQVTLSITASYANKTSAAFEVTVTVSEKAEGEVEDTLNRATTGVTGTSYTDWSGKEGESGAVYAGQSAGGNESIQLRSKNSNSGIITTTSGGYATKVTVVWDSHTSDGGTLNVYGKNTAYSSPTDLFGDSSGTLIGSIVKGSTTELEISGAYTHIGLRSNDGALYITSVTITWSSSAPSGGGSGGGGQQEEYDVQTYTLSGNGAQYADETHELDSVRGVSIRTVECHYTSELRMYSSSSHDGYAIISSARDMLKIQLNMGNNNDTMNVYASSDGETYTLVEGLSVTSTYADSKNLDLPANTRFIKLDVAGTQQIRIKTLKLTFQAQN